MTASLRERIAALSQEKRALLAQRNPLSFAQQRLWFLDQLEPGGHSYNIPVAVRLAGPLSRAGLQGALTEIVRRHQTLRTAFPAVDGQPLQVVLPQAAVPLPVIDLRGLPERQRSAETARLTAREARRPFDLAEGPPLRMSLLVLEPEAHLALVTMHHAVSDGWSFEVFVREMAALYAAALTGRPSPLSELPVQYADYARWQRRRLQGETLETLLSYWKGRLAGLPPVLELPTDLERPAVPTFRGVSATAEIPPREAERVRSFAHREGGTPFIALLAAFQVLLGRYSGQEDIAVGSPLVNRDRVELEGLIGLFQNTLVLRTDLAGNPGFAELLGRVRESALSAHAHQEMPFEMLVDELQPERVLNRQPLFQVMFTLKAPPPPVSELAGLRAEQVESDKGSAKLDLTLSVVERPGRLTAVLEYASDLFLPATATRLLSQYAALLREALADPERPISELRMLGEGERHQILVERNDVQAALGGSSRVHDLFTAQARRRPGAVALAVGEDRLTYGELDGRANRLARFLRGLGIGPERRVGVCLERSADLVVAVLATLKAGGAYVPLDPGFPEERLVLMLADAGLTAIVTAGDSLGSLPVGGTRVIRLEALREEISRQSADDLEVEVAPGNLCYILYTSGSTGRPKGVEVAHCSVVSFLRFMAGELEMTERDTLLAVTTLSFDIAALEFFLPLTAGARIELADRETAGDGEALARRLAGSEVTLLQATPATWQLLLGAGWSGTPGLRALCGGEALTATLARELQARARAVWNVYGPTETTIWSTIQRVWAGEPISLGWPIAGTRIYLAGPQTEPVPAGAPSEICIGGVGVARGYHGQPALTAERFVPDPFTPEPGGRLYRTGDLARWTSGGRLEFLGRIDHQVKVRGYRVEPGEIEARLREHPAVREAAVVARRDGKGYAILAAYVAPRGGDAVSPGELRSFLGRTLPDYMVPSAFLTIAALPRTPNGKIDRRSLPDPEPEESMSLSGSVPTRTQTEEVVAGVWADVLGRREVGARDDFFDLGGHSLLATQVISRLRGLFRIDLPLRSLFEGPTVTQLAARIDTAARQGEGLLQPPIEPASRDGDLPLSFSQQRLWFLDQLEPDNPFYNLATAVRLQGALELAPLAASLDELVRRHEALRTVFPVLDGRPLQRILPAAPVAMPVLDLEHLPESRELELSRVLREEARRPFVLARGPLLRAQILRLGREDHIVAITLHHIVGDRWSMALLLREVATLYRAFAADEPSPLPALRIQYADFARWQRRWLDGEVLDRQLAYWRRSLAGSPDLLRLPTDRPRPAVQTHRGDRRSFALPSSLREEMQRLGRAEGATLFMVLFAGFQVLLHWLAKQEDLVVGANVANRNHLETEGLIGFFANLLPLRTDLQGDPSFRTLLARVRETALGAYAHQDVPFERIVEEVRPKRDLSHAPLVQVVFSFQNVPVAPPPSPRLKLIPLRSRSGTAKFDLVLDLVETEDGLAASLEYNRDLFSPSTTARMAEGYQHLLRAAVARPEATVSQLEESLAGHEHERLQTAAQRFETEDAQTLRGLRRRARPQAQAS